jgi:hypothetical protein
MTLVPVRVEPRLTARGRMVMLGSVPSRLGVIRIVASTRIHEPAPYSYLHRRVSRGRPPAPLIPKACGTVRRQQR